MPYIDDRRVECSFSAANAPSRSQPGLFRRTVHPSCYEISLHASSGNQRLAMESEADGFMGGIQRAKLLYRDPSHPGSIPQFQMYILGPVFQTYIFDCRFPGFL